MNLSNGFGRTLHNRIMNNKQLALMHAVGQVHLTYLKNHIILPTDKITSPESAYHAFKAIFDPRTICHKESMYALYLARDYSSLRLCANKLWWGLRYIV